MLAVSLVFIIALRCMILILGCFIVIQYGLVMFGSSLHFGVEWVFMLVYWYFVFIMEHFVVKSLSIFSLLLYLFFYDLKFVLLVNLEGTRGSGGGHGGPSCICQVRKNMRDSQKGRVSNKKPLKVDIKVEKFLF